jgi:hypothetical protein
LDDEVLLAADIFDPAHFPVSKDDLVSYGADQVAVLSEHFAHILNQQGFDRQTLDVEWMAIKLDIFWH